MKAHVKYSLAMVAVVLFFTGGYWLGRMRPSTPQHKPLDKQVGQEENIKFWTCSMHPQIRQDDPGRCPICGMDLIPVSSEQAQDEQADEGLRLSAKARKLAQVELATVERKYVSSEIRMAGKAMFDETRLVYITAWVPGRIDRLYADYTGISVRKGDHMAELYSPELLSTQQELLQAIKAARQTRQSDLASLRESALKTVEAVREKLRLWGLNAEQIDQIEKSQSPSEHITIYAPAGGIVIDKHVREGAYVTTGARLYTIADLSRVWVKLDAYESDIALIRYGQNVEFDTQSYPGELFHGQVAFIDPVVDAQTRTIKVRVNVENPYGKLKPEMLVRATVRAKITADGRVLEPDLAGKWISPMHPEIVKDAPGFCDICGMPLVRAESLGYVDLNAAEKEAPLVIPITAALITGKRAIVYVADTEKPGTFQGREVTLGPRAGDYYIVFEGLAQGERVVAKGNFKIDSALQILAHKSMMNPEATTAPSAHNHEIKTHNKVEPKKLPPIQVPASFQKDLAKLFDNYFEIQQALSRDQFPQTQAQSAQFLQTLTMIDMATLDESAHIAWMKEFGHLKQLTESMQNADAIEKARQQFALLSDVLLVVAKQFDTGVGKTIRHMHCPMAFNNRGADWLQTKSEIENPYFGSAMFRCGSEVETIPSHSQPR